MVIDRMKIGGLLAGLFLLCPLLLAGQDFEKDYNLPAGSVISVKSISGDIKINGTTGSTIHVKAVKKGEDKDKVQVIENSSANRLELRSEYAPNCHCNASIEYFIDVPGSVDYVFDALDTASGDVSVAGVKGTVKTHSASGDIVAHQITGKLEISTASGDVKLDHINGSVSAKSVSGDVEVNLEKLSGTDPLNFESVSGDVAISAPSSLDAELDLKTVSGDMHTDFPLTIESAQYGPQKGAKGKIGQGTHKIMIKSVSGDIHLKKVS
jgi:DUF4097 and DUF4098 domain-containing protein YvlB